MVGAKGWEVVEKGIMHSYSYFGIIGGMDRKDETQFPTFVKYKWVEYLQRQTLPKQFLFKTYFAFHHNKYIIPLKGELAKKMFECNFLGWS